MLLAQIPICSYGEETVPSLIDYAKAKDRGESPIWGMPGGSQKLTPKNSLTTIDLNGWNDFVKRDPKFQKVNVLTIDTRDQVTCKKIAWALNEKGAISPIEYKGFCSISEEKPLISIAVVDQKTFAGVNYSRLSRSDQKVIRQSRNFTVPAVALMGVFFALPADKLGYDGIGVRDLKDKYFEIHYFKACHR